VELVEYTSGAALRVIYIKCGQKRYDLGSFFEEIEKSRQDEANQLAVILDRAAKYGVVWNNYKTTRLQGNHAQPICEFCGRRHCRIFWFFDEHNNKLIVCTHGFVGKGNHDHAPEIERAQQRRALYYEHKRSAHGYPDTKKLKS
jgi:hypothetical protein